jgi:hypothetical protein
MAKKLESERFCGNCQFHSVYKYPEIIFCFKRFQQGEKAVFSTLDCCELWEPQTQGCFCVKDALERRNQKR